MPTTGASSSSSLTALSSDHALALLDGSIEIVALLEGKLDVVGERRVGQLEQWTMALFVILDQSKGSENELMARLAAMVEILELLSARTVRYSFGIKTVVCYWIELLRVYNFRLCGQLSVCGSRDARSNLRWRKTHMFFLRGRQIWPFFCKYLLLFQSNIKISTIGLLLKFLIVNSNVRGTLSLLLVDRYDAGFWY